MRPRTVVDDAGRVTRAQTARRGCPKLAYASKKVALATAAHQTRQSGERIEAYHCYRCHAYHIGHPPQRYDPTRATSGSRRP